MATVTLVKKAELTITPEPTQPVCYDAGLKTVSAIFDYSTKDATGVTWAAGGCEYSGEWMSSGMHGHEFVAGISHGHQMTKCVCHGFLF